MSPELPRIPLPQPRLCVVAALVLLVAGGGAASPVAADRIENTVAVFAALDKVTARISRLEVPVGESRELFAALKVTARTCYSRPPTEQPKTSTFVEIEERQLDGKSARVFSGWMFAESPGLNAVEHPVFDIWLTECQKPARTVAARGGPAAGQAGAASPVEAEATEPRRRVRR